jgi:hypothetical protein
MRMRRILEALWYTTVLFLVVGVGAIVLYVLYQLMGAYAFLVVAFLMVFNLIYADLF